MKRKEIIISKSKDDVEKFRIILHHEKKGEDSRTIDARTSRNGCLIVGGYDIGPIVEKWQGSLDYEYDASVAAEDKKTLHAALVKELFADQGDFRSWMKNNNITDEEENFDTILLLMIKKLGLFPHDFAAWAREHGIKVEFWSYP
jgi:hypothetical protein